MIITGITLAERNNTSAFANQPAANQIGHLLLSAHRKQGTKTLRGRYVANCVERLSHRVFRECLGQHLQYFEYARGSAN